MIKVIILFILLSVSGLVFSQIRKDLDHDGVKDFVELINGRVKLFVNYHHRNSRHSQVKNGFEYYFHHRKTEYSAQFRFDSGNGKIILIGMKRHSVFPEVEGNRTSGVYFNSGKKILLEVTSYVKK